MGTLSADRITELVQFYQTDETQTLVTVGYRYGLTPQAVWGLLSRRGIPRRQVPLKLTEAQCVVLCQRYRAGESGRALGQAFGVSQRQVRRVLSRYGVRSRRPSTYRRYTCTRQFFRVINQEEKAYWLGFLAADGSVSRGAVQLSLSMRDREHVYRFRRALRSNHPVKENILNAASSFSQKTTMIRLSIRSVDMVADLARYGVVPRKTFCLRWPDIPHELLQHYVRGYVDGDGGFYLSQHGNGYWNYIFSVTGYRPFLLEMQTYLMTMCQLPLNKLGSFRHAKAEMAQLMYGGRAQVSRIFDLLYHDATVWLPRKRDNFVLPPLHYGRKGRVIRCRCCGTERYRPAKQLHRPYCSSACYFKHRWHCLRHS